MWLQCTICTDNCIIGISGVALEWFHSCLNGRSQRVMAQGNLSQSSNLNFGVPLGSCLGPLLFTIYASKLFDVIKLHLPTVHCYAAVQLKGSGN